VALHYYFVSEQVDMGIYKSDPPIPGSLGKESRNDFHDPPATFVADAPVVEEDPLTSSDGSSMGEERRQSDGQR